MKDCKLYVICCVNDNKINRGKNEHKGGKPAQNAHMTRLVTALLGDSIAIPLNTGIKKWEKEIGKNPLTAKNNNEIKQSKQVKKYSVVSLISNALSWNNC